MANPKHVEILKSGVEEWNAWRKENPEVRPDLSRSSLVDFNLGDANLSICNLNGADLKSANLSGANLSGATLRNSNLEKTDFLMANLAGACLDKSFLFRAVLWDVNLSGASCKEAKFVRLEFANAELIDASFLAAEFRDVTVRESTIAATFHTAVFRNVQIRDSVLTAVTFEKALLSQVIFSGIEFSDVRLSDAKLEGVAIVKSSLVRAEGLSSCQHLTPTAIDRISVVNSDKIPDAFLKGCGWQDWEIESSKLYNPELAADEIAEINNKVFQLRHKTKLQIASLFLSYSRDDGEFVDGLEVYLNASGIRYWRDIHDATAGPLDKVIARGIDVSGTVLLVLSKQSVKSDWVKYEVKKAIDRQHKSVVPVLCPVALDDSWKNCRWPENVRRSVEEFNILDFSQWNESEETRAKLYKKLIDGLHIFYSEPKNHSVFNAFLGEDVLTPEMRQEFDQNTLRKLLGNKQS